jgi:hypothetical protein
MKDDLQAAAGRLMNHYEIVGCNYRGSPYYREGKGIDSQQELLDRSRVVNAMLPLLDPTRIGCGLFVQCGATT